MRKNTLAFFLFLLMLQSLLVLHGSENSVPIYLSYRIRSFDWTNLKGTPLLPNMFFLRQRLIGESTWNFSRSLQLGFGATTEARHYYRPQEKNFPYQEIFLHRLFLKWSADRVTFTIGRQNMKFGDGFIIMDASALDGSRSRYFNAIRCDYKPTSHQTVTLFFSSMPVYDNLLSIHLNRRQKLNEVPENCVGLYYSKPSSRKNIDAYLIFKREQHAWVTTSSTKDLGIWTMGTRYQYHFNDIFRLTSEQALQFSNASQKIHPGLNTKMDFFFQSASRPNLRVELVYLDGSDGKNPNGWIPIYSRWPQWSETYIYTTDSGYDSRKIANWTNMAIIRLEGCYHLNSSAYICASTNYLSRQRRGAFPNVTADNKGFLLTAKSRFRLKNRLTINMLYEFFSRHPSKPTMQYHWFRMEAIYSLKF